MQFVRRRGATRLSPALLCVRFPEYQQIDAPVEGRQTNSTSRGARRVTMARNQRTTRAIFLPLAKRLFLDKLTLAHAE